MTFRRDTHQLGKVLLLPDVEEEGDDDDAVSLGSASSSSQPPNAFQPAHLRPAPVKSVTGGPRQ